MAEFPKNDYPVYSSHPTQTILVFNSGKWHHNGAVINVRVNRHKELVRVGCTVITVADLRRLLQKVEEVMRTQEEVSI